MTTLVGTQKTEAELVESLLNLEQDALAAYNETISRLKTPAFIQQVTAFRADHLRHIEELSAYARQINVHIPDGTPKAMMTKGKVIIATLMGDNAICMAMKTNENDTVTAYERAAVCDFITSELKDICERAHQDERKHREWFSNATMSKAA